MATAIHDTNDAIAPRWITFQAAARYVGVSVRTLQNWEKAGHIRTANVCPMGTRGRRLIDREHLDQFIESYVGAPTSTLAVNEGKGGRP